MSPWPYNQRVQQHPLISTPAVLAAGLRLVSASTGLKLAVLKHYGVSCYRSSGSSGSGR